MPDEKRLRTADEIMRTQSLMDDLLVALFFEQDSPEAKAALEEILRTILNDPKLVVEQYHAEHVLTNAGHHSVQIDVWARDGSGRQLALELQKVTDDEELYPRAVFEAATMVVHSLPAGQPYSDLDKTIVIFITQRDLEGKGKPVYWYRMVQEDDPAKVMPKSSECLFVNGKNPDRSTSLGRIIADIQEPDPDLIQTEALRRRMKMLKSSNEGRKKMEDLLAIDRAETAAQATLQVLYGLVGRKKLTLADAAEAADMTENAFVEAMQAYEASQKS
ncbi:MAG: hypothetical protein HDQ87_06070 [Clostridia bacterium]|nr:hypothetical protein [Clostridia bacterium]